MQDSANVAARRARPRLVVALLSAALAVAVVAVLVVRGQDANGDTGPMSITAGDTALTFAAPDDNRHWSATAGTFLLCGDGPVTLRSVTPIRSDRAEGFEARIRQFRIRALSGLRRVAEPVLGGYGTPPWIGGSDGQLDSRLLGALQAADGAQLAQLPPCEKTTSLPGEDAVELLVTVTAGPVGAHIDGVRVSYEAKGERYEQQIAIELDLCGTASSSPDC